MSDSHGGITGSDGRFRTIFESAPIGIVLGDRQRRMLDCNPAFASFLDYDKDTLLGMGVAEFTHPDDVRTDEEHFELLRAGQCDCYELEKRYVRRNGAHVWGHLMVSRCYGDGVFVIGMVRDITKRKESEAEVRRLNSELEGRVRIRTAQLENLAESLRAREEQFRAVAETANEAIVSADCAGNIIYFNPAAARLFGHAPAQALNQPLTLLIPDRFHDDHRRGLERFLTTGKAKLIGTTVELVGRHRDGRELPVELSLAAWQYGPSPCFTAIVRDINERKQTEEEIRRVNMELAAANRELEAFSYSVSHDLRAPLRSMGGFSEALLADYGDKLDEQGQDYLRRVQAASHRMGELIDGLLNLSRVTRLEMFRTVVDLTALAKEIVEERRKTAPERKLECHIAEKVQAYGDPRLIRAVLENLIGNAWKFTCGRSSTRIEFGIDSSPAKRQSGPPQLEEPPVFFVRDNGAGFDSNYAHKLFGAFQRLHSVAEFPGQGIGLATVQRIIHRHGGRIWAESAVDQGATFYFTLPVQGDTS